MDGREVQAVNVTAWIRLREVRSGRDLDQRPMIAISFYDDQRRDLGHRWLGPWDGTEQWHEVSKTIRVPPQAREGILRIGLFGATGEMSVDDLRMESVNR